MKKVDDNTVKTKKTIIPVHSKGDKPCIPIPPLEDLEELARKTLGNKSKMCEALGISRWLIDKWCREHEDISRIIYGQRGKRLDQYLDVAHNVAMGIPDIDPDTKKQIGWIVPPDVPMLRFLIEKIGRMDGFGEELNVNASVSVKGGVPIARWLTLNSEGDKEGK